MPEMMDWQTPAALAVVVLTALAFLVRALRRRKRKRMSGGGACTGCGSQPRVKTHSKPG